MLLHSVFVAGFAGLIAAQSSSSNYTSQYTVDPNSVSLTDKTTWCSNQQSTCLEICNNKAYPNSCDPTTLAWQCVCTGMTTPNVSSYKQTVPFFECQQYVINCQPANTGNAAAQQACLAIDCAPNDPTTALAAYSSSAAAAAASSASAASASSASASATTTSHSTSAASTTSATAAASSTSAADAALAWSKVYGNGILGAAGVAIFGLAL